MRKRLCALMMTLILPLTACGGAGEENEAETLLQQARSRYLEMTACQGHMDMTADYGQRVYTYGVDFSWEKEGETLLTITAPENVAGAVARIARGETAMEYDGVMLETGPLDAAGLSPIDAVPAILTCLREGFLAECVLEDWDGETRLHLISRDPNAEPGTGTETDLWLDRESLAIVRAELSDGGFTVLRCDCAGFVMTLPESGET